MSSIDQYDAFLSYSHEADGRLAPELQRGLQRLAKSVFQRRALWVFRDETGLATNPHLWNSIESAIDGSDWFVLLASPESAASEWVTREVTTWIARKPIDHILIVVTGGELAFAFDGRVDRMITTCLPAPLIDALDSEPRWLDLRWARTDDQLDLRNGRFRAAVADLAAPIHGIPKDDLESEDVRQHRRARRLATSGIALVGVLAVVSTLAAIIAVNRTNEARSQRDLAKQQRRDAQLAVLASTARDLATSQVDVASLLAVEAQRLQPGGDSLDALETALRTQPAVVRTIYPAYLTAASTLIDVSADGSTAVFSDGASLTPVDTATLLPMPAISSPGMLAVGVSPDGTRLAVASADELSTYGLKDGVVVSSVQLDAAADVPGGQLTWLDDSHVLIGFPERDELHSIDVQSGITDRTITTTGSVVTAVDPGRQRLAIVPALVDAADRPRSVIAASLDLASGTRTQLTPSLTAGGAVDATFSADGEWLAVGADTGLNLLHLSARTSSTFELPRQRGVVAHGAFNHDGTQLVGLDATGEVVLYSLHSPTDDAELLRTTVSGSSGVFFAPDKPELYAASGDHLTVLSTDGSEPLATALFGTGDETPFSVRADGTLVHVFGRNGFRSYEPTVGDQTPFHADMSSVPQLYSPDDSMILEMDFGNNRYVVASPDGAITHIATVPLNSDGANYVDRQLTLAGDISADGTVATFLEVPKLKPLGASLHLDKVESARFVLSDDGKWLVRSGLKAGRVQIDVFDRASGATVRPTIVFPDDQTAIEAIAISPANDQIIYSDRTNAIGSIDIATGEITDHVYSGSSGVLSSISYTPDGAELLGLSKGGDVQWWDVNSHRAIGDRIVPASGSTDLILSDDFVQPVAFDLMLHFIVVPSTRGMQRWNFDFSTWPAIACDRAGRNLTQAEWSRYLPTGEPYHATCGQFTSG